MTPLLNKVVQISQIRRIQNQPPPPFPQRFQISKQDFEFNKFLDVLKKLHINIPLVEALEQMPNYVKFMKDILSKKRRLREFINVALIEGCEYKSNTYVYFQEAGNREIRPTSKIEDVLVRVDKIIFPVDFIILECEANKEVPIILGRPFLATDRTLVYVKKGELTMRVNDQHITFNVFDAMKCADTDEECHAVEIVDTIVEEEIANFYHNNYNDVAYLIKLIEAKIIEELGELMDVKRCFKSLNLLDRSFKPPRPSIEDPFLLKLKPLPAHMKYAYLGDNNTLPVIFFVALTVD
ncbi:Integrase, catalytic core [Gossypium australe]|uniref:Integrase, catalytic core n=1 Tax=Gossypium australe TaxID=47621 RepID=A0A5B6VL04_9ROSI|nr:Integrase, catalytic core [Gossypium australe]